MPGMDGDSSADVGARRATSYDVARRAGVSQSAVSRCFRAGASVSAETRKLVLSAARALDYTPNKIARSLMTQRTRIIAVLVSEATTISYPTLLLHLGREIQAADHRMLVCILPATGGAEDALADIVGYHVDAVISGVTVPDAMMRACARELIPVIVYNRVSRHSWASSVGCDDALAMEALIAHLRAGSCRSIHFVTGPRAAPVAEARLKATREAVADAGMDMRGITYGDYSYAGGWRAAAAILSSGQRPDAIMCANDATALGVLDYCRNEISLDVPGELAVTGYDDVPEGAWAAYRLTTLGQPHEALTRAAVRMACDRMESISPAGECRLFPARLLVRGSTRSQDSMVAPTA